MLILSFFQGEKMLERKCSEFLQHLTHFTESEEEDILEQYQRLLTTIHNATPHEIEKTMKEIHHFQFDTQRNFDNDMIEDFVLNRYSLFSKNEKILLTLGVSLGFIYGVIKNFFNISNIFNCTVYGLFSGFILGKFIDHIQERISCLFRLNLLDQLKCEMEVTLQKKLMNQGGNPTFVKKFILKL